ITSRVRPIGRALTDTPWVAMAAPIYSRSSSTRKSSTLAKRRRRGVTTSMKPEVRSARKVLAPTRHMLKIMDSGGGMRLRPLPQELQSKSRNNELASKEKEHFKGPGIQWGPISTFYCCVGVLAACVNVK